MKTWERVEQDCTEYLQRKFSAYATFTRQGSSDSTKSDVKVQRTNKEPFYVEAKKLPAQCGQFVLLPNEQTKTFTFSPENDSEENEYARTMIAHMNERFDSFFNAGTKGEILEIDNGEELFVGWILEHYNSRNVKFFITDKRVLFPIEDFSKYLSVTAKYRTKKSGSQKTGNRYIPLVQAYLQEHHEYQIQSTYVKDNSLYVQSDLPLQRKTFSISGCNYTLYFSKKGQDYEIRRLSNTYHANVIFSISLKSAEKGLSDEQFIQFLTL